MFLCSFYERIIYQVVKLCPRNNTEQHTTHWCKCCKWLKPKTPLCSLLNLNYEINGYCDVRPLNICILHNLITNPFSHELGVVILFIFSAFNLVVLKVWQFFSFFQQFLGVWNLYIKFSNFLGH
jgi:hypothetical protein